MAGLEIFGVALVVVAIIYAFWKKHDRTALALTIALIILLFMLGYFK